MNGQGSWMLKGLFCLLLATGISPAFAQDLWYSPGEIAALPGFTIVRSTSATVEFTATTFQVRENADSASISVVLEGMNPDGATVSYGSSSVTAVAGRDFQPVSGTLTWQPDELGFRTFSVPIIDDNLPEDDEIVLLTLSNPSGTGLGSPSTARLIILDNDQPSSLTVEEGEQRRGKAGTELEEPLVVRVTNSDGSPVRGVTVTWEVTEGEAELLDGDESTTNDQGVSSNRVRLGTGLGNVVVTARVANTNLSVAFEIVSELQLVDLSGLGRAEEPVAQTLEEICNSGNPGGMRATCDALAELSEDDQRKALEELSPKKVAAQGVESVEGMTVQFRNLLSRLAALRRAKQRSLELLAFEIDGVRIPAEALLAARGPESELELDVPDLRGSQLLGGAASADDENAAEIKDDDRRLGFFVSGLLASGDRPDTDLETGFDFDTEGITLGIDYRFTDQLVFGGAVGYMSTDAELSGSGGTLKSEGYSLATYLLRRLSNRWYLEAILGYGEGDFESRRVVDFPGNRQVARADPNGDQVSFALGIGYDAQIGAANLTIFGRGSYLEASIDEYEESGAPGMQLAVEDQEVDSLLVTAGLDFSYAGGMSWGVLVPQVRLSYQHEFEDSSRLITASFVDDPQGLTFSIPTEDPDRDYLRAGGGLSAVFAKGVSAFLMYEEDFSRDDLGIYVITGGLRFELR